MSLLAFNDTYPSVVTVKDDPTGGKYLRNTSVIADPSESAATVNIFYRVYFLFFFFFTPYFPMTTVLLRLNVARSGREPASRSVKIVRDPILSPDFLAVKNARLESDTNGFCRFRFG